MPDQSSDRNPIDELAEEFVERYRRGERPALSEYTKKHPSLAGEIRDVFPALLMMEDIRPAQEDGVSTGEPGSSPLLEGKKLERLGDYRILREVGRGGMGIVYEAEQESLVRHVALKVLPSHALLDPQRVRRFEREAKAVARLHHTNIVPVFGVGEDQGLHYYVMQFIPGQSLDQVLAELWKLKKSKGASTVALDSGSEAGPGGPVTAADVAQALWTGEYRPASEANREAGGVEREAINTPNAPRSTPHASRPTPDDSSSFIPHPSSLPLSDTGRQYWQSVARLGIQVADALAYAHGQGTLHRDIKPSNLLLDPYGSVWVTDFGLAKAAESDDLTNPGDIVGTVRYMAPERFGGKSDLRSDIYGLGITLYEMLTLRPAFDESDRSKLVAQILHQEPPRPRKLNPAVPRDLETIVQKAMAKEPAHRYATTADMAADLKRFTELRPILARRVSPAERLWRWSRRNPVVASMATAIFLLLVLLSAGTLFKNAQLTTALGASETANQEATAKLWESLRDRAKAMRMSRHVGQRLEALRSIAEAMKLPLPPGHTLDELRTEAVAGLALPDIEVEREWPGGLTPGIVALAFDGNLEKYARLAADGTVTVLRTSDDRETAHWKEDTEQAWPENQDSLRFSSDGRYLAISHPTTNKMVVRRLEGSEAIACYQTGDASPDADFTPDGTKLAYFAKDKRIVVVGLPSAKVRYLSLPAGIHQHHIQLSPDGRFAITVNRNGKNAVEVRELATGKVVSSLPHPAHAHAGPHLRGNVCLTTSDNDLKIRVWDLGSETPVRILEGHKTRGINGDLNSTGRLLLSNDWNGVLRLWEVSSGRQLLSFPADGYSLLRLSPTDRLPAVNVADLSRLQLLRLHGNQEYQTIVVGTTNQPKVAVHPQGRVLTVSLGTGPLALFDLGTGRQLTGLPISNCGTFFWELSGALLTSNSSGLLRWPLQRAPVSSSTEEARPKGQGTQVGHLTPDLSPLAPTYRLGSPQRLLSRVPSDTWGFSADGRTIAMPNYNAGAILLHRGPPPRTIRLEPQQDVRNCAVSPDGRWVATGSHENTDGLSAKVWEAATGKLVMSLSLPAMCTVAFSPDGRWLLTTAGGCRLWQVGTWIEGPAIGGPHACFSPDSRLLAVEDTAGAIRLVSTDSGALIVRLEAPEQTRLYPRCFTPDGTRLISTGIDTEALHIWDLREVRRGLVEFGLDWDEPPYPTLTPAQEAERNGSRPPLHVTLDAREPVDWPDKENWQERIAELSKEIDLNPKQATLWFERGSAYGRLGQWQKAISDFSKAITLDPKLTKASICRGEAYLAEGEWEKAAADYAMVMMLEPNDNWYWYPTAALRLQTADTKGYRKICQDMLERFRNTTEPEIKERLALTWLLVPPPARDLDPVIRLAGGAVTGTEQHPYYRWFMRAKALAEYRAGRFRSAVEWLERLSPQADGVHLDAIAFSILAMAQHRLGQKEASREALDQAQTILDDKMPDPRAGRPFGTSYPFRPTDWHDWIHARILFREAAELLGVQKKVDQSH